jgi:hypothetical protein
MTTRHELTIADYEAANRNPRLGAGLSSASSGRAHGDEPMRPLQKGVLWAVVLLMLADDRTITVAGPPLLTL